MSGSGGDIFSAVAPIALSAMFPGIGTAIGAGMGLSGTMAPLIGNALVGAGTSALGSLMTGEDPMRAGLIGALGGGLGSMPIGGGTVSPEAAAAAQQAGNTGVNAGFSPAAGQVGPPMTAMAPQSISQKLGGFIQHDPLKAAMMGSAGLAALSSLSPQPGLDVRGNQEAARAGSGYHDVLPEYTMTDTATPYKGDWYKYGESPEKIMYNARPIRKMACGGMADNYARGGKINDALSSAFSDDGQVSGHGKGQDDSVLAKLSQDEYVVPADVVAHLGDGSSNAGGKALDSLVHSVRKHKATKKFPPKSKSPLSYLPKKGG